QSQRATARRVPRSPPLVRFPVPPPTYGDTSRTASPPLPDHRPPRAPASTAAVLLPATDPVPPPAAPVRVLTGMPRAPCGSSPVCPAPRSVVRVDAPGTGSPTQRTSPPAAR